MDAIGILLYFNGYIIIENISVEYGISHVRPIRVVQSINFLELVQVASKKLNIDLMKFFYQIVN